MAPDSLSRGLHVRSVVRILCGHVDTAGPSAVTGGGDGGGVCQCVYVAPQGQIPRWLPHSQAQDLSQPVHHRLLQHLATGSHSQVWWSMAHYNNII